MNHEANVPAVIEELGPAPGPALGLAPASAPGLASAPAPASAPGLAPALGPAQGNDVPWTHEHEMILVDWGDKALCYKWLHETSHHSYARKNTWFTIPVIIMSTLTGTANFAQDKIPAAYISVATMAIGAVNLIAGILTTIQQFLKISELNEAHRVSSIAWGKFYRNIKVELAKSPKERTPVTQLLKYAKEEFDRLIETSPTLSDKVTAQFKTTFSGGAIAYDSRGKPKHLNDKQIAFAELKKPEICDSLESTAVSLYKAKDAPPVDDFAAQNKLLSQAAAKELARRRTNASVTAFIRQFEHDKCRPPTLNELLNNIDNAIPVEVLQDILKTCKTADDTETDTDMEGEEEV